MSSKEDWLVVAGFLLAAFGLFLRIVLMMRASDSQPVGDPVKVGRELLHSYESKFPRSRLPLLMWTSLSLGVVLLVAGFLLEFR